MSKRYNLVAQKRDGAGKGIARSLRRENKVPAVIYGENKAPVLITLPEKEVRLEYQKGHMYTNLCELSVDGANVLALVRDVAVHPVTDKVEHVDFLRVGPKTKIKVFVPVHFKNEAACPGVKNKGVLNVVSHEVELLCIAQDIPDAVEVDLKDLNIAQSIKLSEIQLPAGAEAAYKNRDVTIVTVVAPTDYSENEITAPVSDEANAAAKAAAAPAKGAAKPAAKK